jgi:glycosyltransferase involved in cell wall biosynthesis
MTMAPRICAVVPVYNHALTVGRVVRGARTVLPVIVVDDGSTDDTPAVLAREAGITVVRHRSNQGKAAALQAGFAAALNGGFTHAITLDADGQHPTEALSDFLAAAHRQPEALIIGVRDLKQEAAPRRRVYSNRVSAYLFWLETSMPLPDTQCGYRCYPLEAVRRLRVTASRYAWELEVMVQAAWAGVPLQAQPVRSDYRAPTSRLSHFRPWRDLAHIAWVHARLCGQVLCQPSLRRRARAFSRARSPSWL